MEGKYGVSKFIKLSEDMGVAVSEVRVVAPDSQGRRRSVFGGGDPSGVFFSVGDSKGTIDLKVCLLNYWIGNSNPTVPLLIVSLGGRECRSGSA